MLEPYRIKQFKEYCENNDLDYNDEVRFCNEHNIELEDYFSHLLFSEEYTTELFTH